MRFYSRFITTESMNRASFGEKPRGFGNFYATRLAQALQYARENPIDEHPHQQKTTEKHRRKSYIHAAA